MTFMVLGANRCVLIAMAAPSISRDVPTTNAPSFTVESPDTRAPEYDSSKFCRAA